jgi:ParB-like nuclease domain
MTTKVIRKLRIIDLEQPDLSQSRIKSDPETIASYKATWETNQANFPAIVVYQEGTKYHIADGFHRVQSLMLARLDLPVERRTIASEIRSGTIDDAIGYSLAANINHGLRPNTADKKRAILLYYGLNPINCSHSNNQVAKACGCSHTFVGAWKATCTSTPAYIIAVETKIPTPILEQTIANLAAAQAEGKIVTTRGGKELIQSAKTEEPLQMPLQMPLQASISPAQPKRKEYIVIRPTATRIGSIHRGITVSGFESLTDTGKVAIDYRNEVVLMPGEDLMLLPYSIGFLVSPIDEDIALEVTGFALIGDDLKIKSIDSNGYNHNHSSTELEPFVKKTLETPEVAPATQQNNIGVTESPATPIVDLLNLTDDELLELQFQVEQETLRRVRLSEDTADLAIS